MKLYCVSRGEKSEGLDLVSIHFTIEGATKAARAIKPCFAEGWIPSPERELTWTNGCDVITITEHIVED